MAFVKRQVFDALQGNKEHRYKVISNKIQADKLRDFLLLKVHFGAIVKFGKLKD